MLQSKHIKFSVKGNKAYRCLAVMLLFPSQCHLCGDLEHGQCQEYCAEGEKNPHSEARKHKPKNKTNFYITNLYFRNIFHVAERNRVLICVIIFRNYSHPKRRSCNCHCPIHKAEIMKMFPGKLFLVFSLHSVYEKNSNNESNVSF